MKFHFQHLGLLEQADLELADLTLICGENNTGKTYATYAVYGFLRNWRKMLRPLLRREILRQLNKRDEYRIDLAKMFGGKVNEYLKRMGDQYAMELPLVFASSNKAFIDSICIPSVSQTIDFATQPYLQSVQAGRSGKVQAILKKEAGSTLLNVLVANPEESSPGIIGLNDFIIESIVEIVFAPHLPRVHIASAERTGAAIFRKELDMARTRILKAISEIDSKELKRNPFKILDKMDSGYALPVEDNVDFVRQLEDFNKREGELAQTKPELLAAFDAIIGGSYKVVEQQLVFQANGTGKPRFTMNEASSSIRALLDIGFYLRCQASAGDLFIIDEPELNLHPKSQRAFARLVARMINAGIKVFITTHSDYLVKELNTLIMLHQGTEHTKKVQQQYGYQDEELLDPKRVRLYVTGKAKTGRARRKNVNTLIPAEISPDRGIEVSTFDDTIESMNAIQSEILYGGAL